MTRPIIPPKSLKHKRYSLNDLATFIQCPARYHYNFKNPIVNSSVPLEQIIAKQTIQLIISSLSRTHEPNLGLSDLQNIINRLVYSRITQEELETNFDYYEKVVQNTMNYVINWWDKDFAINGYIAALINLPIDIEIFNYSYLIHDLDILILDSKKLGSGGIMFRNDTLEKTPAYLYNEPYTQLLAYSIYRTTNQLPTISYLSFLPKTIQQKLIHISEKKYIDQVEKNIAYHIAGLQNNIRFTNTSEECKMCPYKNKCSF